MPELPDLEVIKDFLNSEVTGQTIVSVPYVGPIIVRNMLPGDVPSVLTGRKIGETRRRGKFLVMPLDNATIIVINFMLSGRLTYAAPVERFGKLTFLVLGLSGGQQLRYSDATQMGKIYLTDDVMNVPTFAEQGPDALDPSLTLDVFRQRLRKHSGEIKGILTNQLFVTGIGNAYADEILFRARIYPFRKRPALSADEIAQLYDAMHAVLPEAITVLQQRMGRNIHEEIRDFLLVHGKSGRPCPRCGTSISQVAAQQSVTNFCRSCQPGTLIRQS
jgi:formamidopyrimidine-DNA glycosylase